MMNDYGTFAGNGTIYVHVVTPLRVQQCKVHVRSNFRAFKLVPVLERDVAPSSTKTGCFGELTALPSL